METAVPVPRQSIVLAEVLKKRVMIVLPWLKVTNPVTAFCVANLIDKRRTSTVLNFGDSFVAHSRNKCADIFLQSDAEYMLTIDDDMVVPFGPAGAEWYNQQTGFNLPKEFASLNAMDRLLSHGKTLVGGLYWGRNCYGAALYNEAAANPTEAEFARKAPHDLIKPTRWVATGCLLVHRTVFEDIEKRFPLLARVQNGEGGNWFSSSEHNIMSVVDQTIKMLSSGVMTGEKALRALSLLEEGTAHARRNSSLGMGEDVAFCVRAKEAGHQAFVDLGLVLGHLGQCCYGPRNTQAKPKK